MSVSCVRCPALAASVMTFDYDGRSVWLEEWDGDPELGRTYSLCTSHADRLSPPMGWTLTDRRNVTRLFAPSAASVVA
jgi:hypothetical protein